jgi:ornithine cyclodeaminase/alanine dehydrogenase-like protein (mu-crystallin family)
VKGRKEQFIKEMGKELNLEIVAVDSSKDALLKSDIMVTATSFVDKPYVKKEWIREGDLGILVHH